MPKTPDLKSLAVALQAFLNNNIAPVQIDGIIGKQTREASSEAVSLAKADRTLLLLFQGFLQKYFCADTVPDGIFGPKTGFAADAFLSLLSPGIWGGCPAWIGGLASHYGGPHDPNDRYLDQAYLPSPRFIDPESKGRRVSPQRYFMLAPDWVRSMLNPAMADYREWPMTKNEKGQSCSAGLSYFLSGHYVALRLNGRLAKKAKEGKVRVKVTRDGKNIFVAPVIDYGPHPKMWASIDLSPELYRTLNNPARPQLQIMWEIIAEE